MKRSDSFLSPMAVGAVYLFAAVLVLSPIIDLLTSVLPARPGDFSWRYGFLGLGAGYLQTPVLGLVIGLALAFGLEHAGVLKVGGVLSLLAAVALLFAMAVFALDVLQMRGMRAEEMQSTVLASGLLQEFKYLLAFLVLAPLGIGAWKTARPMSRLAAERARQTDAPGIVSRGGG